MGADSSLALVVISTIGIVTVSVFHATLTRMHYGRGSAWQQKREHDRAITDHTEAIRLAPEDAYAYYNRGDAWIEKKEYDKALAIHGGYPARSHTCRGLHGRGHSWLRKGDFDKAIADFDQVIRLDARVASAYDGRGYAWGEKEYDRAIADYTEAIRLAPKMSMPTTTAAACGSKRTILRRPSPISPRHLAGPDVRLRVLRSRLRPIREERVQGS